MWQKNPKFIVKFKSWEGNTAFVLVKGKNGNLDNLFKNSSKHRLKYVCEDLERKLSN